jgi:nicotinamide phosphoribosyltransferase
MTDSYKASHFLQYPEGTEYVNSYIEARPGGRWQKALFFGLQMFLMEYMTKPFTMADIDEAEAVWTAHGEPFNRDGWEHILKEHNGFMPIIIEALPEGTIIENGNVLVQIRNTDPKVPWLTSFMETAILRAVWYPTTVASNSFAAKQLIYDALVKSSDDPDAEILFKMHDFGARGVSSAESAGIGGAAHLVNFMGSDTIEGIMAAREYYDEPMAAFSIPAAEHSTITSWGGPAEEINAFRNMLKQFAKPGKMLAVVSDSYDIMRAVRTWGTTLHEEVKNSGAIVVVRPDSGDPIYTPVTVILELMNTVGFTINSKGYKVLPDYFRVIQGDGITTETVRKILHTLEVAKVSASNLAFGQGGGLLQMVNRDDLRFAMKASAIEINGEWQDVYKEPVSDPTKNSKRGILAMNSDMETVRYEDLTGPNMLKVVYQNKDKGVYYTKTNFAEVRKLANEGLVR